MTRSFSSPRSSTRHVTFAFFAVPRARLTLARNGGATAVLFALVLLLIPSLGACSRSDSKNQTVTIAAAQSLRAVLPDLVAGFLADHPKVNLQPTFGASGDLKKQVEAGAPIDLVIFASAGPVDELISGKLADATTRRLVARNQLVLVGPKGGPPVTFETIDQLPGGERLAIGEPGAVPAGQYAKEAFQKLGKWEGLSDRLVFGGDVSTVLAYVRRGEVPAAVVYRSEVQGIPDVVTLDEGRPPWAPTPQVVAAVTSGSKARRPALAFLDFLASPAGQKVFADRGFQPASP